MIGKEPIFQRLGTASPIQQWPNPVSTFEKTARGNKAGVVRASIFQSVKLSCGNQLTPQFSLRGERREQRQRAPVHLKSAIINFV